MAYTSTVNREALDTLSTVSKGSLEGFKLFYEELKPAKNTISRMRRVRPALATK